jgi:hypothetical protein
MSDLCVAPLSTPVIVANATLISLFLFVRHGARTPTYHPGWPHSQGIWDCGSRYTESNVRTPLVNGNPTNFGSIPRTFTCIPRHAAMALSSTADSTK